MRINYIFLKALKSQKFIINNNLTIITDYSGSGKTLLFKFIEFVLGADGKHIKITEAKKIYPELEYIEMSITKDDKEYIFKKTFDFKEEQVTCNNDIIKGKYNDILNDVINYNPIKVLKNMKMEQVTFSLREYIKAIFFNEAKLTSNSPLTTEVYTDKTKIKNFYKYLVTGIYLDENEVKKANKEIQIVDGIDNSLKILKKEIEQPTNEDKITYKVLNTTIRNKSAEIVKIKDMVKDLNINKSQRVINIERLNSLKQLFESQIEDVLSAKQFEHFLKDYTVECQCGNNIKLIDCEFNDDEYKEIKLKIKDINKQIETNKKELNKINSKIDECIKALDKLEIELNDCEKNLSNLTKKIEDYDVYLKLTNIFNVKKKKRLNNTKIENQQSALEKQFNINIKEICIKASARLKRWGIQQYSNVEFNDEEFEFTYDGTLRYLLSKGYKNICTCAVIIEILLKSITLQINSLQTIVIDSFWSNLYIKDVDTTEIINKIVKDLESTNIQIIIMENTNPSITTNKTTLYDINSNNE